MKPLTHLTLAGSLAALVGTVEALSTPDIDVDRVVLIFVAVGLVGTVGILLGALQAALVAVGSLVGRLLGLPAAWLDTPSAEDPRGVVRLHAVAFGILVACLSYAIVLRVLVPRVFHIDDESFARELGVLLFVVAVVGSAAMGLVSARTSIPLFFRVGQRVRLPWPRVAAVRWILWLGFPTAFVLGPILRENPEELGDFAIVFWLVAFIVLETVTLSAIRPLFQARQALARRLQHIALFCIAVALGGTAVLLRQNPVAAEWTTARGAVGNAAGLLRALGDFDDDGYSAWLGGGDCAPLDADVNPGSRDLPDNERDENCDGTDAEGIAADDLRLFSQALAPDSVKKHNVVLIVVDSVRWDHTGLGEYRRGTTPYLDTVAEESLVFQRAYAQSSATEISTASILTGRDPSALMWQHAQRLEPRDAEHLTILSRLSTFGYTTAVIGAAISAESLGPFRSSVDYEEFVPDHADGSGWLTGGAGPVTAASIRYVEQRTVESQPFFLTIHIPDPRAGYERHAFGISRFGKRRTGLYDGEIANADRQIGFFVEFLKYRGLWNDTVVIITSNHGEDLGAGKRTPRDRTCDSGSTHVPLIVHIPTVEHATVELPVGLLDIAPTVAEAIGATGNEAHFDGQSLLVPALAPELVPRDRAIPCATMGKRGTRYTSFRRALRTSERILEHDLFEDRYALYDTMTDPKEEDNVYAKHRDEPAIEDLRGRLVKSLTGNLEEHLLED